MRRLTLTLLMALVHILTAGKIQAFTKIPQKISMALALQIIQLLSPHTQVVRPQLLTQLRSLINCRQR